MPERGDSEIIDLVFEDIPEGFERMPMRVTDVYRRDKLVVLLGIPGEDHDCDEMACGSVGPHVIAFMEIVKMDGAS